MAPKAFADALLRGEGVICTRGTRVERVCIEPVAKLGRRGLLLPSGQPSPALAARMAQRLAARLPTAAAHCLPGLGHMGPSLAAEAVAAAIERADAETGQPLASTS